MEVIEADGEPRYYPIPTAEFSGGHIYEDGLYDPGSQEAGGYNVQPYGTVTSSLMARSQRQHVHLDVASSMGGKMVIPFITPFESIPLDYSGSVYADSTSTAFSKYSKRSYFLRSMRGLGTIHMESYHNLRNLQTATTNGATIQIYGRPIGVKVWMLSSLNSFDVQGIFSNFWTSKKQDAPVASNTQVVRKVNTQDFHVPTIEEFARKPAVISVDSWSTSYPPGGGIMAIPIHPMHRIRASHSSSISPNQFRYTLTPAAFVAMNYRLWRGTARISLRVICTTFHRGRLRVTWEPNLVDYLNTAVSTNARFTPADPHAQSFIWDISTSSEVTFDVGFGALTHHLNVPSLKSVGVPSTYSTITGSGSSLSGGIDFSSVTEDDLRDYMNGVLMVHVENKLQAPTDCTVSIVATISFPDLQLFDSLSQTVTMDSIVDASGGNTTASDGAVEYRSGEGTENALYNEVYAPIPAFTTRPHTIESYIPQGVGSEPLMLDKNETITHTFQPTTNVPLVGLSTQESLLDLILREVPYDVHHFELPMAQEVGDQTSDVRKAFGSYYPPYLIKGVMPAVPGLFGTVSPCRMMAYAKYMESNASVGYTVSISATNKTIVPNLARTHFALLLKECYIGYRSSFQWRFTELGSNCMKSQYISMERVNAGPNLTLGANHPRTGSYPSSLAVSPYATVQTITSSTATAVRPMTWPVNVFVKPLNYNDGTSDTAAPMDFDYPRWYTRAGVSSSLFGTNTLQQLRKRLLVGVGSFFSGGAFGVNSVVATIPYFARTRYLPGSSLGWMFAGSNQENSTAIAITAITEAKASCVAAGAALHPTQYWESVAMGFPSRATLSLVSSVQPSSDYAVTYFVNVPNLYALASDIYVTESANS